MYNICRKRSVFSQCLSSITIIFCDSKASVSYIVILFQSVLSSSSVCIVIRANCKLVLASMCMFVYLLKLVVYFILDAVYYLTILFILNKQSEFSLSSCFLYLFHSS